MFLLFVFGLLWSSFYGFPVIICQLPPRRRVGEGIHGETMIYLVMKFVLRLPSSFLCLKVIKHKHHPVGYYTFLFLYIVNFPLGHTRRGGTGKQNTRKELEASRTYWVPYFPNICISNLLHLDYKHKYLLVLNLIVIWVYDSSKSSILSFIWILYFKFDRPIIKHVYNRRIKRGSSRQQL